jgi:CheY-like chemotaxis protein
VIIVDLNMPEMDGFETVRRIRAMLNVHKVEINRKRSLSNIYFAAD